MKASILITILSPTLAVSVGKAQTIAHYKHPFNKNVNNQEAISTNFAISSDVNSFNQLHDYKHIPSYSKEKNDQKIQIQLSACCEDKTVNPLAINANYKHLFATKRNVSIDGSVCKKEVKKRAVHKLSLTRCSIFGVPCSKNVEDFIILYIW